MISSIANKCLIVAIQRFHYGLDLVWLNILEAHT